MASFPDDVGGRSLPSATRGMASIQGVNYSGASNAIAALGRAQQNSAQGMMDQALQREKDAEKDATITAAERELQAKREVLDILYGKDGQDGLYNRKGSTALGVEKVYQEKFKDIKTRAMEGIEHPDVQKRLGQTLDNMDLSNLDNLKRYESAERRSYSGELISSKVGLAAQTVANEWNNDVTFKNSLAEAENGALAISRLNGLSKEGTTSKILEARSGIYKTRLYAMMGSDNPAVVLQANKVYKEAISRGDISFSDVQDLDKSFETLMPKAKAYEAYGKFKGGDTLATLSTDEIFQGMIQQESAGNHYDPKQADGITTSKAGAKGIAQLMPETAKEMARELNIDPSAWLDPEINAVIGKAYLQKMQNEFGDNTLAVLAYNWGPGSVKKHIKEVGDPRKGETSMDYFLASIENDEARNYVPKVMGHTGITSSGKLDYLKAQDVAATMEERESKEFLDLVKQQNDAVTGQERLATRSAVDEVFQFMQQNKGNGWTQMPNDLRVKAAQVGIAEQVQSYTGQTSPTLATFLYSMQPKDLKDFDLDDPSVRFSLSPEDYDRWKNKQGKLDNQAYMVTEESKNRIVKKAFEKRSMSVQTLDGKNRTTRLNELLDAEIDGYSAANNGKYPGPAEIQSMVDNAFVDRVVDYDMVYDDTITPYNATIDDIPNDDRQAVEEDLAKRGLPASDAMIIKTWLAQLDQVRK